MNLRDRWETSESFRRGVIGALAGATAGITAAAMGDVGTLSRYGVALFVGLGVFIALKLLVD